MKRTLEYKEYLLEIADSDGLFTWETKVPGQYTIEIQGHPNIISEFKEFVPKKDIELYQKTVKKIDVYEWSMFTEDDVSKNFLQTGWNTPFSIMSSVMETWDDFIDTEKPDVIFLYCKPKPGEEFSKKTKRAKLYEPYISKRIENKWKKYEYLFNNNYIFIYRKGIKVFQLVNFLIVDRFIEDNPE